MSETMSRLLSLKTCNRYEQRFIYLLRALVAGPGYRSQAIHELEGLGINPEAAFVFLGLMESLVAMKPRFAVLSVHAKFVSLDELNLLTALRRTASVRPSTDRARQDLGFAMPLAVVELIRLAGDLLRHSSIRFGSRPMLASAVDVTAARGTVAPVETNDARVLRRTVVLSNEPLAPRMRRIKLSGESLRGMSDSPPGKWVKVFPARRRDGIEAKAGDGLAPVGRVYTIRHFAAESHVLTIDVALHGGGAVSGWLECASPGDEVDVAGSRGGFDGVPSRCTKLILAGDETALPAIAAILKSLPPAMAVHAFIEIDDDDQRVELAHASSTRVQWLTRWRGDRSSTVLLKDAVLGMTSHIRGAYVWAAGEAGKMRELRRSLITNIGIEARNVHTVGYWKQGDTDHRDAAAG